MIRLSTLGRIPLMRSGEITLYRQIYERVRASVLSGKLVEGARKLARSPLFNSRLVRDFPPGSSEGVLISSMTAQGFVPSGKCRSDASIHIASFHANGRGFLGYATDAQVYWRADQNGRVIWTKGFVAYTGL
jgi:hypothetical protein